MNRLLDEKVAVVTGGSRGLGLAICRALSVDGAKVLVVSRSQESCLNAVAKLTSQGGIAAPCPADVTQPEGAARIVEEAQARFGGLDILVNNAGVFVWKKFLELTAEDWRHTIDTNLGAPFFLMQKVAGAMIGQGRGGAIINVASIHGVVADPNVAAHCASKWGLVGLTKAVAEALREFDIRVNAVAPGSMEPESGDRHGESPRRRVTQADVANLVVYLASHFARSITGSVLEAYGNTRVVIKT